MLIRYAIGTTDEINTTDVAIWTGVGAITGGYGTGLWGTVGWSSAGGAASSYLKDEDPLIGGLIGGGSALVGYSAGKLVEKPLQSWLNPVANKYIHETTNKGALGITGHFTESFLPTYAGGVFGSGTSEWLNNKINEKVKKFNYENTQ